MSSWLQDHREEELQTFRARFTDEQWAAFRNGYCSHVTTTGQGAALLCLNGRDHARIYCNRHTWDARENSVTSDYGSLVVPISVRSMDISEVP